MLNGDVLRQPAWREEIPEVWFLKATGGSWLTGSYRDDRKLANIFWFTNLAASSPTYCPRQRTQGT